MADDQDAALAHFDKVEANKAGSSAPEAVSVTVEDF
ncbi:hypothetical protein [Xanthomonas phage OP1]|uniref:Uncharacterized protein n=1 Tax=Xanthomonas phage OP1 TaxID=2994040 RepID=Q2NPD6_9CAUD|nr:hypothetical protein OP1_ORF55 [Xanthomonas phage OP1]BAE72760.1 hypothetical protein [Xanthomonas phage OP1]